MPAIHWILYVHFDKFTFVVKNLLPNAQRPLGRVHLFHVARVPTMVTGHFIPIPSTAIR